MTLAAPDPISKQERLLRGLTEHVLAGGTIASAFGLTPRHLECMYGVAHDLYGQGRYEQAAAMFGTLMRHDHTDRRFVLGHAACLQMQGQHAAAVTNYALAAAMDLDDPVATFHACECLLALGHRTEAIEGLQSVLEQCDARGDMALRQRASALHQAASITKQTKEQGKK
jgi:type III secretion system low calcium response chaperone LcrH/SycD